MNDEQRPFSRRIGSRAETAAAPSLPAATREPWTLHIATLFAVGPVVAGLLFADSSKVIGALVAIAGLQLAARLIRRGRDAQLDYDARAITKAPPPFRLVGHIAIGIAGLALASIAGHQPLLLGVVAGGLVSLGSVLAYGLDPRRDKGLDAATAERAGLKTEAVLAALEEAHGKVRQIEAEARGLHSRELKERLSRITRSAAGVLLQLEQDPKDIRRARRFLVTYLDGTRDVVAGYRRQQQDLSDTPLAENFRHVLETVERVFAEQAEVLRRNDSLDLEVQIDVLKTQLEREGVH
jgi:hypothetical protein